MNNKIKLIFLIIIIIILPGFGFKQCERTRPTGSKPITLNYWRVWDGPDAFSKVIRNYRAKHPNIKINYRKLTYAEYEQELLEGFATDQGPDIFSLHNTWMNKYQSKGLIAPLPPKITMVYKEIQGRLKKEEVWAPRTSATISQKSIQDKFIDVIYDDAVITFRNEKTNELEKKVFGLPLFVDTLVMFYNRDLFNNAGITSPPEYWNKEFQQDVKKLTKQNSKGEIIQSGVSLGAGENIERASDILSLLMMQNGTVMMNDAGVTFHQRPANSQNKNINPGQDALRFYTDFANPAKEVYSWNKTLDSALDMFIQGKLAMMFGYSYMLPQIRAYAPKLNFSIAKLPQIENNPQVNFANYWMEVVSKKSKHIDAAWDFIQFITTNPKQAEIYLTNVKKPTALRPLVDKQIEDPDIGIFAKQVLTAKSWYQGNNANAAELIMKNMIDETVAGHNTLGNIINSGAQKVQQTIR